MRLIQDQGFERAAIQGETIFQVGPSWAAGILIEETSSDKACRKSGRAITCFNVGWDQLASSAGPPSKNHGGPALEALLVPPYSFRRPNKACRESWASAHDRQDSYIRWLVDSLGSQA